MRKVLMYSLLLVFGLVLSQLLPTIAPELHESARLPIKLLTMAALSFIMIHVGYEFELDKSNPGQYGWDYIVAATAAAFPWIFAAMYFVYVMAPSELWDSATLWKEALLTGRFASPTSAGVLFSMLAAAGLAATWVFKKARILAIFDDLDTILLMIPLKMMMVGFRWQLAIIVFVIAVLLWIAWRYLHEIKLPIRWPYVLSYAIGLTVIAELVYEGSKLVDKEVPIHLEVLLPAFVIGCVMARPKGADPHRDDATEGAEEGPEDPQEQRVSTIISATFMLLVGLSMPPVLGGDTGIERHASIAYEGYAPELVAQKDAFPGWGMIALHVFVVTVIVNIGKMFPAFCYKKEAHWKERLAVAIGMFPRGEVGAGVLVISLSYGIGGPMLTVAMLSLALNLLLTGVFILIVKRLIAATPKPVNVPATAG